MITRFWRIDTIPSGMHIDEIGMAYDAWSLSQFGVDRYLKSWPVYLTNFGGGQSSLYCFLCAGLFKLFGYHILLVRLPGILGSLLGMLFGMLLTGKLFPEKRYLPILTGIIFTACPYFILASRIGLDCNLMMGFSVMFLYWFTLALEKGQYGYYALAGLTGGLVLYTYAISYIVLPLFLICSLLYEVRMKRFSIRHWAVMAIPMGILAFPLIMVQIINMFDLPEMKLGIFTLTKLEFYRAAEVGFPKWTHFVRVLTSIFIGDPLIYNSIPGFPNLYFLTTPLCFLGLVHCMGKLALSWRRRQCCREVYSLFWFLAMVLTGSTTISNSNKINGVFGAVVLLAVEGVFVLTVVLQKHAKILVTGIGIIYGGLLLHFGSYYYTGKYTLENYPLNYFHIMVSEAIDFLEANPEYQNKGTCMAQPGICYALSSLQAPMDLGAIEDVGIYNDWYHTGALGLIDKEYNYIVTDIYVEYAQELRDLGYYEIKYPNYSLFYME